MLQYQNNSQVIVCAGVSGSGKSTFGIRYLLNADFTCRFIFDPRGEYAERLKVLPVSTPEALHASIQTGWCVFDPSRHYPGLMLPNGFADFCDFVFHVSEHLAGQKIIVVDEVWKYCSPNTIPQALAQIVQEGRKNGLGLMVTSQRPNRINEGILNEANEWVVFQLRGKRALECVQDYTQLDPDEVRALPKLHFVSVLDSGEEQAGQIQF